MSTIGNIAKSTFNYLSDFEGKTEKLTFIRYDGSSLAYAAEVGDITKVKSDVVILKINPESISYTKPKITQKIQTSSPGRFVVFDWGTDLLNITINGNTGNLLPGIIQSGFNPMSGFVNDVARKIPGVGDQGGAFGSTGDKISSYAQKIMMDNMTYSELIGMSPKYRTFIKLQKLYDIFDADADVLVLEAGENIYRGYFFEFSFDQVAESPWNWKYSIQFIALNSLSDFIRRGDSKSPKPNGSTLVDA